mgnify:FL=1
MAQDLTQEHTYVVKNYNVDTGEFEVYYNDGSLKNDDWYGPLHMDLDSLLPEDQEPLNMQIAGRVHAQVERRQLEECDMEGSKSVLAQLIGVEQTVSVVDLMNHQANMSKTQTSTSPICSATQVMNIYSEDDFDEQFEALSAELAED